MLARFLLILLLVIPVLANAQMDIVTHYSSLEIEEEEAITFHGDTLLIDTLKMYDNSSLVLTSDCYIHIKHAFIGKSVRIDNRGMEGQNGLRGRYNRPKGLPGQNGTDGGDIRMFIRFEALGSLNITTNGGNGGHGGNGASANRFNPRPGNGERGHDGAPGGDGGNGGDSGDIYLTYQASDFVPIVGGKKRLHSINLSADGGDAGRAGRGGEGGYGGRGEYVETATGSIVVPAGEKGANGLNGSSGKKGKDGIIKIDKKGKK